MRDILRDAGHLTLGSRLKRLGERLQGETQSILGNQGVDLPAALHPYLLALDVLGETRIGDLALSLGQSQPGVTRSAKALEAAGLVETRTDDADRRVRILRLTGAGRALVETCRAGPWRQVESAARDACAGLSGSVLDLLDSLEERLDDTSLRQRSGEESARRR